jgi:hypothetical protein
MMAMKKILFIFVMVFVAGTLFLTSCINTKTIALNSIELTNQLRPGMTYDEVEAIMGEPKSSLMDEDKWIARWNLQEMWKGYVPYDLVFTAGERTLISWSENSEAFEARQAQLKQFSEELEKQAPPVTEESATGQPASFESDQSLVSFFEGSYYSYSAVGGGQTGGTERKLSLCANGRYDLSTESGYSGGAGTSGAWGTSGQGGGTGSWKITGNKNTGTISFTNREGKTTTYKYETCGSGCIYIGNVKYAYSGKAYCR